MERFYFDTHHLQFARVPSSWKKKLLNSLKFFGLVALFLPFILMFNDEIYQGPKLKRLIADQEELAFQISLMNRDVIHYSEILENIEYNDDHLYRVYFEVEPVPSTQRNAGTGGASRYRGLYDKPFDNLLLETFLNLDDLTRKLVVQSKSFDQVIDLAKHKEQILAARPAIQPVSIKELTRFGSAFGMRLHPILKTWRPHDGIDLTAPRGTKIYATADGVVKQAEYTTGGYGRKILIDHGYGYTTVYGHCSKILVSRGQQVKRGEVIGEVGNTGLSTTSHLHYEVRIFNKPVNPIYYYANDLSAEEYDKMINLLSKADPSFDIN
jgi:murein DD-endopeptidase MepM/ murein hydrolase activator NlpD